MKIVEAKKGAESTGATGLWTPALMTGRIISRLGLRYTICDTCVQRPGCCTDLNRVRSVGANWRCSESSINPGTLLSSPLRSC